MADDRVRVGIHGALGRMGARLVQLALEHPSLRLSAALGRPGHKSLGHDIGPLVGRDPVGVVLETGLTAESPVDVVIDFSLPEPSIEIVKACREYGIPVVVGTTGFTAEQRREIEHSARSVAVLLSPNMSRAVNVLMQLVDVAARALAASSEIEIIERHHKTKKDAPSGTALKLAEIAGRRVAELRTPGQTSENPQSLIATHALRIADCPGEHTVVFGLMGETLELSHRAINRDGFVRGSLEAARFLAGKPPGLYGMADILHESDE